VAVGGGFPPDTGGLPLVRVCCCVRIAGLALIGPPGAASEPFFPGGLTGVVGRSRELPLSYGLSCVAGLAAFGCFWAFMAAAACCFYAVPGVSERRRASPSPSKLGCAAGLAVSRGSWALLRALWAGCVVLGRAGRNRRVGRVKWAGRACRGGGAGRLPPT